jgi:hypothetical protein
MVAYAFAYFLPIILHNGLGFSTALSQVLSFPPYALAAVWMFIGLPLSLSSSLFLSLPLSLPPLLASSYF